MIGGHNVMLEIKNLSKTFGDKKTIENLSFSVDDGEILGIVGKNGVGKTTTFRMILNLISPDRGEILWNGEEIIEKHKEFIGYLPEERGLFPNETIEKQLLYFSGLKGKKKSIASKNIDYWMNKLEVKGEKSDKVKWLSKGNQQKVQLIATIIHNPKLVILDEPFSGLDPINAEVMKETISDLKARGVSIIFSSHNMANVEEICDKILLINDGKKVMYGSISEIRNTFGRCKVYLDSHIEIEKLRNIEGVTSVKEKKDILEISIAKSSVGRDIFELAAKDGYISTFSQQPLTIEEIFKMMVGKKHV